MTEADLRTFSSPAADISFQEYPQIKPMITAKIVMVTIMRTLLSPSSVNEAATATIRSTRRKKLACSPSRSGRSPIFSVETVITMTPSITLLSSTL